MAVAIPMPLLRDTGTTTSPRAVSTCAEWENHQSVASDRYPQRLISYQGFMRMPLAGPRLVELWRDYARNASTARIDKASALRALEKLKTLPPDWNGYGAIPIDRGVIRSAQDFILS